MGEFDCEGCGKSFNRKEHLEYHISHGACKDNKHYCKLCDKGFTTATSMYRHMRSSCKVKKQNDDEKESVYNRLLQLEEENKKLAETQRKSDLTNRLRIEKLAKDNAKLKNDIKKVQAASKVAKITNNTTNNNTTNNTNSGVIVNMQNHGVINNITLVAYGTEDMSKLSQADILKALQSGYYSTVKLTEAVHFNPKHPEYHNVYISNMKDKYAMMFDGKDWTLTTKEDLISKIYDDKKNYIEENLDTFIASLPPSRKKALERWLDTDDEDAKIKEIKDSIKLLLYNSKEMTLKQKKLVNKSKSIKALKLE
ncbi:hypothetical protein YASMINEVIRUS_750 [Yasminevirus sp. GU-2018]|uniref:C2H2-type domain-containing protein n=1 Tax=Yasminevirus sp. GU-2018 TaxID=2420051 RepID=A0A5K0U8R6_9VIRU|nr:hypothetical protein YASMINEVIRUS_750 [Yasminevirus sp. GU-2018]